MIEKMITEIIEQEPKAHLAQQVTAGPQGIQGIQGPTGPAGVSEINATNLYTVVGNE